MVWCHSCIIYSSFTQSEAHLVLIYQWISYRINILHTNLLLKKDGVTSLYIAAGTNHINVW